MREVALVKLPCVSRCLNRGCGGSSKREEKLARRLRNGRVSVVSHGSRFGEWILKHLGKRPDIYLRELQAAAKEEPGWEVSDVTLSRACRALKRTREKDARRQ